MNKLPVIAAVPNYNMGEQLRQLLPGLLDSGYDAVYVLDDASTDGSRDITHAVSPDVCFVPGAVNKGAGANRNRILGALPGESIVHFVDADTSIDTERSAEVVADSVPAEPFGFIGGLALTLDGIQSVWNYGPRQSLWSDLGVRIQKRIEPLLVTDPAKAARLRHRYHRLLADWPDPLATPVRRPVFWAIEQNLVVNSRTLADVGGFDESLREHEIQDLAIRMAARGLKRYFDPAFSITHLNGDVREYNRNATRLLNRFQIHRKHGHHNWVLPGGRFRPHL